MSSRVEEEEEPLVSKNIFSFDDTPQIIQIHTSIESTHKSSTLRASYNVICSIVGAGFLQLPYSLAQGGWLSLIFFGAAGLLSTWTSILLIKSLDYPTNPPLKTYGDLARFVYGERGRWWVSVLVSVLLLGVGTIMVILSAINIQFLFENIPSSDGDVNEVWNISVEYCILLITAPLWFHIWLPTLHEVGILSAINVVLAVAVTMLVIIEVFSHDSGMSGKHEMIIWGSSLGGSFNGFLFSFAGQPLFPPIYDTMEKKEDFPKMLSYTFIFISFFYLPLTVLGYWAYGSETRSPIYDNICSTDDDDNIECSLGDQLSKYIIILIFTLHVMCSYVIIMNALEQMVESMTDISSQPNHKTKRAILRTILVIISTVLALVVPSFGDMVQIFGSLINPLIVYILPILFFWNLYPNKMNKWELALGWMTIVIAVVSSVTGVYDAIHNIICEKSSLCD